MKHARPKRGRRIPTPSIWSTKILSIKQIPRIPRILRIPRLSWPKIDKRFIGTVISSGFIASISIAVLAHIHQLSSGTRTLVSDGKRVFSPAQLVGDQAYFGLRIAVVSLVLIVVVAVLGRRSKSSTAIFTVVLALISLGAATFVAMTFQQYRGFLPIG